MVFEAESGDGCDQRAVRARALLAPSSWPWLRSRPGHDSRGIRRPISSMDRLAAASRADVAVATAF